KFLPCHFARRIDRNLRIILHNLDRLTIDSSENLINESICFTACRAVADGNQFNIVFIDHLRNRLGSPCPLTSRLMRKDSLVFQEFSSAANSCHLATGAKTGIDTKRRTHTCRTRKEEFSKVSLKIFDRFKICNSLLLQSDFAYQRILHKTIESIP